MGNLILPDEGVGVHAVQELEGRERPPQVEVLDGGTATMDLLPIIQDAEPKEISWGMELTPEVKAKVPKIIEVVFEELEGLW